MGGLGEFEDGKELHKMQLVDAIIVADKFGFLGLETALNQVVLSFWEKLPMTKNSCAISTSHKPPRNDFRPIILRSLRTGFLGDRSGFGSTL